MIVTKFISKTRLWEGGNVWTVILKEIIAQIQQFSDCLYNNFFQMFSSNSSGFDKELAMTRIYQLQDPTLGQSSVQFVQSLDQFDLEQSCLIRLKAQRQKIEELTKLYQENQKELNLRAEKEKKLQQEVQKLQNLSEYKQSYSQLKRDYDALVVKEQTTSEEFQRLRKEFDQTISAAQEDAQSLRNQIRLQKQQRILAQTHWEAIVADRDQVIKKQARAAQQKQAELVDRLNKLEEEISSLREVLEQKTNELESTSFDLQGQIKAKDEQILNYDKLTECMRRQLADYKTRLLSNQTQWQKEKLELSEIIDQYKIQQRLLKKQQAEKENQIYEFKEMIKRCDGKNQTLEQTVNTLKTSLKKVKGNMDTSIKKLTSCSEEQKGKLESFVHELKSELQKQMDQKSTLALQVKRLRGLIDRKEQQERQRKLMLMNEFREIDKVQKMVKKII